jgi:hypothetical protein
VSTDEPARVSVDIPAGSKPGTVWVPNPRGSILGLVRLNGGPTHISIRLSGGSNACLPMSDGSGYVLDSPPGLWRARPDGRTRISSGMLLATGPTGWLVRECDQGRYVCGRGRSVSVVIDRLRGTRRVLPGPALPIFFTGAIAPNGSVAAMFDPRHYPSGTLSDLRKTTMTLLDLHTGERRSVPVRVRVALGGSTVVWSPVSISLVVGFAGVRIRACRCDARATSLPVELV